MKRNSHPPIKHIWFDFAGTLYKESPELKISIREHSYKVYGELTGKSEKEQIKREVEDLYETHGSYSAAFRSLGKADDYWQREVSRFHRQSFFGPDEEVIQTLDLLSKEVNISLFTNFK